MPTPMPIMGNYFFIDLYICVIFFSVNSDTAENMIRSYNHQYFTECECSFVLEFCILCLVIEVES